MDKSIIKKITKLRIKLNRTIEEKGLNSDEVRKLSDKMDELINEYNRQVKTVEFPKYSKMSEWYKKSYTNLKKITYDFKKFPSVKEWNLYAKNNNLLSNVSLEYISDLNWNLLKVKVEREINFKVIKSCKKNF